MTETSMHYVEAQSQYSFTALQKSNSQDSTNVKPSGKAETYFGKAMGIEIKGRVKIRPLG